MIKLLTEYIENALSAEAYDDILLKFEKQILEEGRETAERVKRAGLDNDTVILDLIKSDHPDLRAEYAAFRKQELKKKAENKIHKFMLKGTPVYFLLMAVVYLSVSFLSGNWRQSWLIIIAFVTVWVDYMGIELSREISSKRRLFHPAARVLLGLSVMMTTSFIYLVGLIVFAIPRFWVIFPAGVFVMYCVDAIFAKMTDQKLRIINYLIYVPAAMPMIYVILAGLHIIPWHPGWLLMPLSVLIDIVIMIVKIIDNRKYIYRPEE